MADQMIHRTNPSVTAVVKQPTRNFHMEQDNRRSYLISTQYVYFDSVYALVNR
jgi:hypothetical protein